MIREENDNALDEWINKRLQNPRNLFYILIAFVGFFFAALPIILTQYWKWVPFKFDQNTGAIGDTFGGIFGPFVSLLGVILTFFAFYMQYKANEKQNIILRQQRQKEIVAEREKSINDVEKRFFFLIEHYFRMEAQLNHSGWTGKSAFGVCKKEVEYLINVVHKTVSTQFILSNNIEELSECHKYAVIKISVDLWWEGYKEGKNYLLQILTEFANITGAGNPNNQNLPYIREFNNHTNVFNEINDYIIKSKNNSTIRMGSIDVFNFGLSRSNQFSAYYKTIYSVLTYINNIDSQLVEFSKKKEWIRFFVDLLSDEELDFLAYVSLSKVLYGLEIGPKEQYVFWQKQGDAKMKELYINKMIISKYQIFEPLVRREFQSPIFVGIFDNHTYGRQKVDGLIIERHEIDFDYPMFQNVWLSN